MRKMRRSTLYVIFTVMFTLSLVGCGKSPAEDVDATADDTVDLDLTNLSSTMVYSEVYNMMTVPEDYIGKTIKMNGTFAYYKDETTGNEYFSCIIQDATACCAQGIEFILTGDYRYPEDYPADGSLICVSGDFDTYEENGVKYCTLRNAKFV